MMLLTRSPIETMPIGFFPSNTGRWRTRSSVMTAIHWSTDCSGCAMTTCLSMMSRTGVAGDVLPLRTKGEGDATLEGRRAYSRHCAAARLPWPNDPPDIRHASAVRADDMVGSCEITSYWKFSAVKYRWSVGAMDIDGPPLRLTSLASLAL